MGYGTNERNTTKETVWVDLKFAPARGDDYVGFRQTVSRTPREGAKEGEPKYEYQYKTHKYVDGAITKFWIKEEEGFDKQSGSRWMGYVRLRDPDPSQPDVVVGFPLYTQAGRKLVGLIAAAIESKAKEVYIYTNLAKAGDKIGDKVFTEPRAFINAREGTHQTPGARLEPLYFGQDGRPLLDDKGRPLPLPMGEKVVVNRREVYDFSKADDVVTSTVETIIKKFGDVDAHDEVAVDGTEDGVEDEDLELQETAQAAMR